MRGVRRPACGISSLAVRNRNSIRVDVASSASNGPVGCSAWYGDVALHPVTDASTTPRCRRSSGPTRRCGPDGAIVGSTRLSAATVPRPVADKDSPRVQPGARRHGSGGIHGNRGNVVSVSSRIYRCGSGPESHPSSSGRTSAPRCPPAGRRRRAARRPRPAAGVDAGARGTPPRVPDATERRTGGRRTRRRAARACSGGRHQSRPTTATTATGTGFLVGTAASS